MRKGDAFLALLALLMAFAAAGLADAMQPYARVKADIPDLWTEDFETPNGPVTIRVAIGLPARDTLPLLELEPLRLDASALSALFPDATIDGDASRCFVQMGDFGACVYPAKGNWAVWPTETGDAENAELSGDALRLRLKRVLQRLSLPDGVGYQVLGVLGQSRTWLVDKQNAPVRPLNDHGYYAAYLRAQAYGISLFDGWSFDADSERLRGPSGEQPQLLYYDSENFQLLLSGYRPVRTLLEDCPLLPFEEIAAEIGRLVESGHLRRIDRMELCYLPMWADEGASIVTVPAWVLWGEYHENASAESNPAPADAYQRAVGGYPLLIPAQTGRAIDYADNGTERWTAAAYLPEAAR